MAPKVTVVAWLKSNWNRRLLLNVLSLHVIEFMMGWKLRRTHLKSSPKRSMMYQLLYFRVFPLMKSDTLFLACHRSECLQKSRILFCSLLRWHSFRSRYCVTSLKNVCFNRRLRILSTSLGRGFMVSKPLFLDGLYQFRVTGVFCTYRINSDHLL